MEMLAEALRSNQLNKLEQLLVQLPTLINEPVKGISMKWTLLHLAASLGLDAAASILILHGADPEKKDAYGWTPAHIAAFNGHLACLKKMVSQGVKINALNDAHENLLFLAVDAKKLPVINFLVEKKANVFEKTVYGIDSVQKAITNGTLFCLKILLDSHLSKLNINIDKWHQIFSLALRNKQILIADYLFFQYPEFADSFSIEMQQFPNPEIRLYLSLLDTKLEANKFVQVFNAIVQQNNVEFLFVSLRFLIKKNLIAEIQLHELVSRIKILASSKQIISFFFDNYPQDALAVIKLFEFNLAEADSGGNPIGWLAIESDNDVLLKQLLQEYMPDKLLFNTINKNSILHYAVQKSALKCVRLIVNRYSELLVAVNMRKESILHTAAKFNQSKSLKYLLEKTSVSLNTLDIELNSPLHVTVIHNHITCAELLLAAGANTGVKNNAGKLPIEIAKENKYETFMQLFEDMQLMDNVSKGIVENVIRIAVFQGGGVKGAGFLGALETLINKQHLKIEDLEIVAGTSAGAISAFLLAIGYNLTELKEIVTKEINFYDLLEENLREEFFGLKAQLEQHNAIEKFLGPNVFKLINRLKSGQLDRQYIISVVTSFITEKLPLGLIQEISKKLGIHDDEYQKLSFEINVLKAKIDPFLKHFSSGKKGLFAGNVLRNKFIEWLERKNLDCNLTFKELHLKALSDKNYKSLYVAAYNANQKRTMIFSHETTPDAIIADAVRASMSIQIFFEPHQYYLKKNDQRVPHETGHFLYDGGSLDNYILSYFDKICYTRSISEFSADSGGKSKTTNPHAIGFRLLNPELFDYYENGTELATNTIKGTVEFILSIVSSVLTFTKQESDYMQHPDEHARTICINTLDIGTVEFDITPERTNKLIQSGANSAEVFLKRCSKNVHVRAIEILKRRLPHHTYLQDGVPEFNLPANMDERFNFFFRLAATVDSQDFYQVLNILRIDVFSIRNQSHGDSLFHYAVRTGSLSVLNKLLTKDTILDVKNKDGLFPVDCILDCKDSVMREKILNFLSIRKTFFSSLVDKSGTDFVSMAQKIKYLLQMAYANNMPVLWDLFIRAEKKGLEFT